MRPFSEVARFEQGNFADPYYATGSSPSIGEVNGFSTALANKEQIRMTFNLRNSVVMPPNSASIYYLNGPAGQWCVPGANPQGSSTPASLDVLGGASYRTNWRTVEFEFYPSASGSIYFEDHVGFDCYGKPSAKGSLDIHRTVTWPSRFVQTLGDEPEQFQQQPYTVGEYDTIRRRHVEMLQGDYPNSVQRNAAYNASTDESFALPIDRPFLIEKVVVEVPMLLGNNWFVDRTTTYPSFGTMTYEPGGAAAPAEQYAYDRGGPAMTLSLFCQKSYGTTFIRDLVSQQVITHRLDSTRSVRSATTPNWNWGSYMFPLAVGIDLDRDTCVVDGTWNDAIGKYSFTGSVIVKTTAGVSNGMETVFDGWFSDGAGAKEFQLSNYEKILSSERISLQQFSTYMWPDWYGTYRQTIVGVDPFGRGMTGFTPSGGSVFGGEYISAPVEGSFTNPFYVADAATRTALVADASATWDAVGGADIRYICTVSYSAKKESPYMVQPGERMVLALSKTRPAMEEFSGFVRNLSDVPTGVGDITSASYVFDPGTYGLAPWPGHDVILNTGDVNVTFYGSYVSANKEYVP